MAVNPSVADKIVKSIAGKRALRVAIESSTSKSGVFAMKLCDVFEIVFARQKAILVEEQNHVAHRFFDPFVAGTGDVRFVRGYDLQVELGGGEKCVVELL